MLHAVSVAFALAAAVAMLLAIAGMVSDRQHAWTGWGLRAGALLCFAIAVILNVAAH